MMKPTDLADATARALDLLDPTDLANSDPRIFRDPYLVGEIQQTREAAAEVWLAVSPLRVAPAEVLHELMAKIEPSSPVGPKNHGRVMPWIAVSGWAAAVALGIFLWPAPSAPQAQTRQKPPMTAVAAVDITADIPLSNSPAPRESRVRKDIIRLQERLASVQQQRSGANPHVIHLTAPGSIRRTAEESRQRVQSILTEALRSALESDRASPSDSTELVIERGWLPGGLPLAADGGTVRHRNFPEHAWQEMGLLRSEQREYLDAIAKLLWSPALDGRGFTARKITEDEDVSRFTDTPSPTIPPVSEPRTVPEGFIIEGGGDDNKVEVVIDQVPAPAAGNQQLVIITDTSGHTQTLAVTPPNPAPVVAGEALGIQSMEAQLDGYLISTAIGDDLSVINFSLPGLTPIHSFRLVERSIIEAGRPDQILVEGGP